MFAHGRTWKESSFIFQEKMIILDLFYHFFQAFFIPNMGKGTYMVPPLVKIRVMRKEDLKEMMRWKKISGEPLAKLSNADEYFNNKPVLS